MVYYLKKKMESNQSVGLDVSVIQSIHFSSFSCAVCIIVLHEVERKLGNERDWGYLGMGCWTVS